MKKSIITFALLFLYNTDCQAEGQGGLNELSNIINSIYYIGVFICFVCYAIIARSVLKWILKKKTIKLLGKEINNSDLITSFVIIFLVAIFLIMILYVYSGI